MLALGEKAVDAAEPLGRVGAGEVAVADHGAARLGFGEQLDRPGAAFAQLVRDGSGWFTGEIAGTPNMREGKVVRMTEWLTQRGLRWEDVEATFYSDSMNDVPLLEKVDHPVATNPDARLRALAEERGWRIVDLFSEAP